MVFYGVMHEWENKKTGNQVSTFEYTIYKRKNDAAMVALNNVLKMRDQNNGKGEVMVPDDEHFYYDSLDGVWHKYIIEEIANYDD